MGGRPGRRGPRQRRRRLIGLDTSGVTGEDQDLSAYPECGVKVMIHVPGKPPYPTMFSEWAEGRPEEEMKALEVQLARTGQAVHAREDGGHVRIIDETILNAAASVRVILMAHRGAANLLTQLDWVYFEEKADSIFLRSFGGAPIFSDIGEAQRIQGEDDLWDVFVSGRQLDAMPRSSALQALIQAAKNAGITTVLP